MRTVLALGLLAVGLPAWSAEPVPLWGRWETTLTAAADADPEVAVRATLTAPSGKQHVIDGFWDGGRTWKVRFMPDEPGDWRFATRTEPAVAGLDRQSGTFACRKMEGGTRLTRHGPLRVAASGTYLEQHDGTPFFWLGDTVWNGPALSTADDWQTFLNDRRAKHFSVIQFNVLCPWRAALADREGRVAFKSKSPVRVNPEFFQQLDARMDAINAVGMVAAPVLVWANHRDDPGNTLDEADRIRLARYQVARYGAHHVVWILAGDNRYDANSGPAWMRVGRAVFGDRPHAPVTTHPTGMNFPWEAWRKERWLDLLGYQSGHGDDANTLRRIHSGPASKFHEQPPRPILNLEPPYEDHRAYQSRKPHSAYNVRRAVYWSLLATPPAGVTYGAHGIWGWATRPGEEPLNHRGTGPSKPWNEAMRLPGSEQMGHLAELFGKIMWWRLRPSQDLLKEQPGGSDPARFVAAARTAEGDLALVYLPVGGAVTLTRAEGKAEWFDPRTGTLRPAQGEGGRFAAPDTQDWLLLLRRTR